MKYFSYEPEYGLEFHKDKESAIRRAESTLEEHRDNASEGWDEDSVKAICWGEVSAAVVETKRYPAPEGSEWDEFIEFGLEPVK